MSHQFLSFRFVASLSFSFVFVLKKARQYFQPFKRQHYKMVKHAQKICRLLPMNFFSVCDHFVGLSLKGLKFSHEDFLQ